MSVTVSPSCWPPIATWPPMPSRPIEVDYEPLPAVIDMEAALADGAAAGPRIGRARTTATPSTTSAGTTTKAVAAADVVVKRRFVNQRLIPSPMETRAVVAAPMGTSGELTIWSATQIPHVLRVLMALATGIPENKLRVIAPDVGGGFGAKLQFYREELLADGDRQPAGPAGEVDRVPQREHGRHPPRPRPDPVHRDGRQTRRHDPRA